MIGNIFAMCLLCFACAAEACTPYVEEQIAWNSASFRPHAFSSQSCKVGEAAYRNVVGEWLRMRSADAPRLASLSLGRAVSYPWISVTLADSALRSPGWAKRIARAKGTDRDRLAAAVITDPDLVKRLAAPFEGTSYEVVGISFEKVLFGRAADHSSNKDAGSILVPFDAQLWLRLKPRK